MDSTYTQATSSASENKPVSKEGFISKRALVTFISGATIVFAGAIYYCLNTQHRDVAAALTGAYVLICILGASMYKSFK
jgi:hypothetical protein